MLDAVFVFVFTPSPLELITCNKQCLNSVLLSYLLKFWVLVLNYKCPNRCGFFFFFAFFCGLICDFLKFPAVKSSKFSQRIAPCGIRILNTKKVGFVKAVFFDFFKFMSFTAAKNLVL